MNLMEEDTQSEIRFTLYELTIRAAQGIHKGCPAPFDLSSNRGVQGFEGDCAEVRAARKTEGNNSPADCF